IEGDDTESNQEIESSSHQLCTIFRPVKGFPVCESIHEFLSADRQLDYIQQFHLGFEQRLTSRQEF
ncbi:MAG: hypothetical protein ACYT04_71975, partial [Nostoc sp.]